MVQLAIDGCDSRWYGLYGPTAVYIDVQRIIKRAEMWAFFSAFVRLKKGPACIETDWFGGRASAQVRRRGV